MIDYRSPQRQRLVDDIVVAVNNRNLHSANLPWSCIQYWRACHKVQKADEALIRYDRQCLIDEVIRTRKIYRQLPDSPSKCESAEAEAHEDAIEMLHDHQDTYGEVG